MGWLLSQCHPLKKVEIHVTGKNAIDFPAAERAAVYDLSNLQIVTPRFHKEALEKVTHFGGKK
jgi:hypothetical protein